MDRQEFVKKQVEDASKAYEALLRILGRDKKIPQHSGLFSIYAVVIKLFRDNRQMFHVEWPADVEKQGVDNEAGEFELIYRDNNVVYKFQVPVEAFRQNGLLESARAKLTKKYLIFGDPTILDVRPRDCLGSVPYNRTFHGITYSLLFREFISITPDKVDRVLNTMLLLNGISEAGVQTKTYTFGRHVDHIVAFGSGRDVRGGRDWEVLDGPVRIGIVMDTRLPNGRYRFVNSAQLQKIQEVDQKERELPPLWVMNAVKYWLISAKVQVYT